MNPWVRRAAAVLTALPLATLGIVVVDTGEMPLRGATFAGRTFERAGGERLVVPGAGQGHGPSGLTASSSPALPEEQAVPVVPEKFDEPPPPSAPPPPRLASPFVNVTPSGGHWAVLIGINDYPGKRYDLASAAADAEELDGALAGFGIAPERRMLVNQGAVSANTVRTAVRWLVANAGPDSTAIFFYAGHVRKLRYGTEAIVGGDGGLIPDHELAELLSGLQARQTWITLAACYAGGFDEVLANGRVLTAAAGANQLAYENTKFGRSYLVEYMVRRAMVQQGRSVVEDAFATAVAELRHDYPNRVPNQVDRQPGSFELRVSAPRAPSGSPDRTGTGGSHESGGSTGGGSSPPPSTTSTIAPRRDDNCGKATLGVIRCGR